MSLNFPVSKKEKKKEVKNKRLFCIAAIIHIVPLGMPSSKVSRIPYILTEIPACPPSEKA